MDTSSKSKRIRRGFVKSPDRNVHPARDVGESQIGGKKKTFKGGKGKKPLSQGEEKNDGRIYPPRLPEKGRGGGQSLETKKKNVG